MANLVEASMSENASSSVPLPREPRMNCNLPMCPNWFGPPVFGYMYPAWVFTIQQPSGGIYAVQCQVLPFMGVTPDFYLGGLVPIAYTAPSSRYQIGAFAPLLKWLSHSARRAMTPAQTAQDQHNDTSQVAQAQERRNLNWHGFMKEVQMVVIGFVASLFPGFRLSD